jgi:SAM-dependent methyltransferase
MISDLPSAFVSEWVTRVARTRGPKARALDLAMGRGRHSRLLARVGYETFGVDLRQDVVRQAVKAARGEGLVVRAWCADLTISPLPRDAFDLVLVTRYLQRSLFRAIHDSLRTGGVVMYETFTTHQRGLGFGPSSPDHLLRPGELARSFLGFNVLFAEEVVAPEAVARLVARKNG